MASNLTLYWSGRGASIAAQDFAVSGTTVEAYGSTPPTYDATAARVGSLGGNHDGVSSDPQTRFLNEDNVLLTPQQGCYAAWVNWRNYGAALYSQQASSWPDNVTVTLNIPGAVVFRFSDGGANQTQINTADGVASLNNWYFIIIRWNSATPYRRLEVYDTNLDQVAYVESSASWTPPANLGGRVTVGESDGMASSYIDNVFLSLAWDEPVLANALIDDYADYDTGEAALPWIGSAGVQRKVEAR